MAMVRLPPKVIVEATSEAVDELEERLSAREDPTAKEREPIEVFREREVVTSYHLGGSVPPTERLDPRARMREVDAERVRLMLIWAVELMRRVEPFWRTIEPL